MFQIYDCVFQIHHFYRHESSLEKRVLDILKKIHKTEHRFRHISYFHLANSVEIRFQSSMTKEELEKECKVFLSLREINGFLINEPVE